MKKNNKEKGWEDISIVINGVKIPHGVTKVEYTESGKKESVITHEQADAEILFNSFSKMHLEPIGLSPKVITWDHKIIDGKMVHNIHLESRAHMITVLKRMGINIQYGMGDYPISYTPSEEYEVLEDTINFIRSIKIKEWNEAPE